MRNFSTIARTIVLGGSGFLTNQLLQRTNTKTV